MDGLAYFYHQVDDFRRADQLDVVVVVCVRDLKDFFNQHVYGYVVFSLVAQEFVKLDRNFL